MATPEQNALLALQLFAPPARGFEQYQQSRLALLSQGAEREWQREREDIRDSRTRDLARDQNQMYITRENARQKGVDERAKSDREEREKADVRNEIDRLYPQYAAAAARAKQPIRPRGDYPEDRKGLGQLAADLEAARVGYDEYQKSTAAEAVVGEIIDMRSGVDSLRSRIEQLSKPTAGEDKMAKATAAAALKSALINGDLQTSRKLKPDQITKGVAALTAGDIRIATDILGEEAIGQYQLLYDGTLMQAPNTKSRLQMMSQEQMNLRSMETNLARAESDVRRAAATNPFISEGLKKVRSAAPSETSQGGGLKRLTDNQAPTFDLVTPPKATDGAPAPTGLPNSYGNPLLQAFDVEQKDERRQSKFRGLTDVMAARDDARANVSDLTRRFQTSGEPIMGTPMFSGGARYVPILDRSLVAEDLRRAIEEQERAQRAYEIAAGQLSLLPR